MRGRTSALKIEMDTETRKTLLSWLRRQKTPAGLAKRARAMLLLADGQTYSPEGVTRKLKRRRGVGYGVWGVGKIIILLLA
ncbi:MAG TPA: hypothetical protein V6C90_06325 [Coleofasciculaceae cyanobacterium]|jgi:hypothetical protein